MRLYRQPGQMDLSDRIAIETGLCRGESFKMIARRLHRHPSTIAHEVKERIALNTHIRRTRTGTSCRIEEFI